MFSVQAAQERILEGLQPVGSLFLPLDQAAGRVLSRDILAALDLPAFNYSSMDGFAVQAADVNQVSPDSPQVLQVVADIPAGVSPDVTIQPGQAARIMTGGPLPPGADAVVMVEDTDFNQFKTDAAAPQQVTIFRPVKPGQFVRQRGEDLYAGQKVLAAGRKLRAQEIGLLAMLGLARVEVHRLVRVAMLSSGDELLSVNDPPSPGKVYDANSYSLAALAEDAGAEVIRLGVAADTAEDIHLRLERAVEAQADGIVSSAGVSVGAFDYVREVVEQHGNLDFWKVNMRPGKPLAFGHYRGIPFFGLPGNPVSAFVGFQLFVIPAIERLAGMGAGQKIRLTARLAEPVESDGRESYLRSVVTEENGRLVARLTGHQASGNIFSLVQANALLIVPSGVKALPAGAEVEVWLNP
jgi:molybdopterin molybdotransferase